jgi:23S rRNA pseudouridine1911/1915/1917 synthase
VSPSTSAGQFPANFVASPEDAGKRLDRFLVTKLAEVSRSRVQQLISEEKVLLNGALARASVKLRGGETVAVLGEVQLPPLKAIPEDIPLDIVYEDDDLAVINKPAGMMVHAGAGASDDERNRGTLVNALLHRFQKLSNVSGDLRPGIVHRLDKDTSGLIVVAKNDSTHRKLGAQFSGREVHKRYIALLHGWLRQERGTIRDPIGRDRVRRTRMTTRRSEGREAITDYRLRERFDTPYGKFSLVDVDIHTGRTHQIRVHMASLGHPVVGDTLYGAPSELRLAAAARARRKAAEPSGAVLSLGRNFLHAASLEFLHPRTGKKIALERPLPAELGEFMEKLQH